ncbi:MAG: thioredoxin family protein [Alphaproteobacteria bacterium]|jgi:thioredoxin-related protein|nr:thioredoxin family protein [Alphaproteobacteria bacterium]
MGGKMQDIRRISLAMLRLCILVLLAYQISANVGHADQAGALPPPEVNEEGMHVQPWFLNSFLDLREDAAEAAAMDKQLVIFWEQRGCPYCREMHRVNLRLPETVSYITEHFVVLQLNLWGDREVTDFDGQVLSEKKLGRKWRVQFTPTISFLPKSIAEKTRAPGGEIEVWRLMGYWKPFHFHHSFVYVRDKGYISQPNFQRWLQKKAEELRAQGKEVRLWD